MRVCNVFSLAWFAAGISICLAVETLGSALPGVQHEFYSWKWAGDEARAYMGEGVKPEYLPKDLPMPELTARERARGFVVFQSNWMARTFPVSVPKREQITDVVSLFASRGEFEPATFLVRPQKPLQGVLAQLESDLVSTSGARIPKSNVRLGVVNGWTKYGNYYSPIRTVIAPIRPIDIDKDYSEQFWITVEIPEDAKPGVYKGTIEILVGGSLVHELVLEVEVLGINLLEPDAAFGMYFDHTRMPTQWATADYMEKYYRDMSEHGMNSVTFYCTHGRAADGSKFVLSRAAAGKLGIDVDDPPNPGYYGFDQEVVYDFAHNSEFEKTDPRYQVGLDVMMERAGRAGLLRRDIPVMYLGGSVDYSWIEPRWKELNIPWPGGTPNAVECRVIADRAREKDWPEFLFYLMDEIEALDPFTGGRRMLWMREIIRPIKAAGLRTADATGYLNTVEQHKKWRVKDREMHKQEIVVNDQGLVVDELLLENIYHYLDITLFSTTMGVDDRVFDKLRTLNKEYWLYNCAQSGLHPEVDRFHYGLYTWRTGAKGFFQWHYNSTEFTKDGKTYWPWMDKDGVLHNTAVYWPGYAVLSPMGPIPTISWEAVREGVDDYRYLLTLRKLIEQAEGSGSDEMKELAAEAGKAVEAMMATIPVDAGRRTYTEIGAAAIHGWREIATEDYGHFRRTVAEWIMLLEAARSR